MARVRIHDEANGRLAFDLRDLLRLLKPTSTEADWTVSPVWNSAAEPDWFMATGAGGRRLEALAKETARISGAALADLARETTQVIWGEFAGTLPASDAVWVTIRAIDGSFFEIVTDDLGVIGRMKSAYTDVRD